MSNIKENKCTTVYNRSHVHNNNNNNNDNPFGNDRVEDTLTLEQFVAVDTMKEIGFSRDDALMAMGRAAAVDEWLLQNSNPADTIFQAARSAKLLLDRGSAETRLEAYELSRSAHTRYLITVLNSPARFCNMPFIPIYKICEKWFAYEYNVRWRFQHMKLPQEHDEHFHQLHTNRRLWIFKALLCCFDDESKTPINLHEDSFWLYVLFKKMILRCPLLMDLVLSLHESYGCLMSLNINKHNSEPIVHFALINMMGVYMSPDVLDHCETTIRKLLYVTDIDSLNFVDHNWGPIHFELWSRCQNWHHTPLSKQIVSLYSRALQILLDTDCFKEDGSGFDFWSIYCKENIIQFAKRTRNELTNEPYRLILNARMRQKTWNLEAASLLRRIFASVSPPIPCVLINIILRLFLIPIS